MMYNKHYMNRKQGLPAGRQGFTLIELMIVMVIMGILVSIGVTGFMSSQIKGRDTTRKGDLKAIGQALELYYNDNGQYPGNDTNGGIKGCYGGIGITPTPAPSPCPVRTPFLDVNNTLYMAKIPSDPVSTQRYYYQATAVNGVNTKYQLYAHLENSQDPQIISTSYNCATSGTAICNYGISSANTTP